MRHGRGNFVTVWLSPLLVITTTCLLFILTSYCRGVKLIVVESGELVTYCRLGSFFPQREEEKEEVRIGGGRGEKREESRRAL